MRTPRNAIEEIEWARRRLERAKRLIEDGHIQKVRTTDGEAYICQSQSRPEESYLVERRSCPCQDDFQLNGQKLCKHILARLILEEGINLKEIGKDPLYWRKDGSGKAGSRGRRAKSQA